MNDILSSQYGLSFQPFGSDVPVEALTTGKQIDAFLFRVTQQLRDGGFVAVTGEPGTGKSAVLRIAASRLQALADTRVGIISPRRGGEEREVVAAMGGSGVGSFAVGGDMSPWQPPLPAHALRFREGQTVHAAYALGNIPLSPAKRGCATRAGRERVLGSRDFTLATASAQALEPGGASSISARVRIRLRSCRAGW